MRPIILQVEQYNVNTQFLIQLLCLELTSAFQQHANTAGTIVGTIDGGMAVGFVRIMVSKGTRIPMRTQHNTLLCLWIEHSYDVLTIYALAIE